MCTLILLDRVVPGLPLVVASNRDEYYHRPAAPPVRIGAGRDPQRAGGEIEFVAPQDLEAGGTWMGLNVHGMFVGLTNRPTERRRSDRRSRGLLVLDALRERGPSEVAALLREAATPESYSPFNLLYANGREAYVSSLLEDRLETRPLEPGIRVLCNRDVDDPAVAKVAHIRSELARLDLHSPFERLFAGLTRILSSHVDSAAPLQNVCVHTQGYGTRSSALWAIGQGRRRFWYADGPPCESKYRNYSALLEEIQPAPSGEND